MIVKAAIPDYVQKVARTLVKEGYKCYLVGGALRDIVMNIEPDDYDLATDAKPDEMLKIFPKSISVGAKFGVIFVFSPDSKGENHEVQVTTFRSEENYVDGRWPAKVEFTNEIDGDLGRRDFTWNAMALNLSSADLNMKEEEKEWDIYDPFGGLEDLKKRIVKAVGTPIERFREDGLRAFRACRLASQLDFEIEKETFDAIKSTVVIAQQISVERIRDEFLKTLKNSSKPSKGIDFMRQTGLLSIFLPELVAAYGVEQKLFHKDDVYYHLLKSCDLAPDRIKIAALFHDIGKPQADMGNGHFYGHDNISAEMTKKILTRLRLPKAEVERNVILVKNHMFFFPHVMEGMSEEEKLKIDAKEWTDSAVRRFIARVGEENIEDLFALRIADASSNPKTIFNSKEIDLLQQRISQVREKDMALKVTDLKVKGSDLMEIGIPAGPEIGRILHALLEMVLDDPIINTKEQLLEEVKKLACQKKLT